MMNLSLIVKWLIPKRIRENAHLDFIITSVIWGVIVVGSYFDILTLVELPPTLAAAIFTVIIGTIGALFSILVVYNEVILAAKNLGDTTRVTRSYIWPVEVAVFGFLISILSSMVRFDLGGRDFPVFTLSELNSLLMLFLLIYAIFSFRDAFLFTIDVVIGMEERKFRRIKEITQREKDSDTKHLERNHLEDIDQDEGH